ncbi:hypothetical protein IAU60_002304 [Kwoniella sp. DSM 27419]
MTAPTLSDIPSEVILEHLLPALQLKDIAALSAVNRHLHGLTNDPAFWRTKTLTDFTFPSSSHPSVSTSDWWKRVYLGLLRPKAYVWGDSNNDRLGGAGGINSTTRRFGQAVDRPARIQWDADASSRTWKDSLRDSLAAVTGNSRGPDQEQAKAFAGAVELQAGGWSFTARCSDGSVWVWGQLSGPHMRRNAPTWQDKYCPCPEPTRIPLPCRVEAVSAGRQHLLVLDSDNLIWELCAWGMAYHHTAPALTSPAGHGTTRYPPHIVQLSTGWDHSAALAVDGSIHVWYPFSRAYEAGLTPLGEMNGPIGVDDDGDEYRAIRWGTVGNDVVMTLDALPTRPTAQEQSASSPSTGWSKTIDQLEAEWEEYRSSRSPQVLQEEQKVIKIASGQDFIVALKQNGEVWFTVVKEGTVPAWQYLPHFSSPYITHITAQFRSLTSYATPSAITSRSSVYHVRVPDRLGEAEAAAIYPDNLSALQDRGVIQVANGDYHYAALTDRGEMLTWGQGNAGQLGRGRDRSSDEPSPVVFPTDGSEDEPFVFGITAAGWHTGALVLGGPAKQRDTGETESSSSRMMNSAQQPSDGSTGDSPEDRTQSMPGEFPLSGARRAGPEQLLDNMVGGGVRAQPFFRVGFAGRGGFIGSGRGRGGVAQDEDDRDAGLQGAIRGMPQFRIGFAGRGVARGRGNGSQGNNEGNGIGFNDNGPQ